VKGQNQNFSLDTSAQRERKIRETPSGKKELEKYL
jgi:hypothetical protein